MLPSLPDLTTRASVTYSQTGEEGVLEAIFGAIGEGGRFLVDVGAGNGITNSNSKRFLDLGWRGARFDVHPKNGVIEARVTAENICGLLTGNGVPRDFDFLTLDIDGIDWWVLRAMLRGGFKPRVIVCEINPSLDGTIAAVVPYDPDFTFDRTHYFGGSLGAFKALGEAHGYVLVHCLPWNAFFVRRELFAGDPKVEWGPRVAWPPDQRARPWHHLEPGDVP